MNKPETDSPRPQYSADFSFEQDLLTSGSNRICGLDEAGRGPLAGPVVAAAVILQPDAIPDGLQDSKKLSEKKREQLFTEILQNASVSIASVGPQTIDRINIRAASLLAMKMAANGLEKQPGFALVDGNALPEGLPCPARAIVKGDARSVTIAAASIIAKVTRDRLMVRMDTHFPGYGLARHKGYPTRAHREALIKLGPCPLHRLTFAPVKSAIR